MSRFSKAEYEARGWVFVHEQGEEKVVTSETMAESRIKPAHYRAEKYLSLPGQGVSLINFADESLGKVLEQVHAFEEQLEAKQVELTPGEIDAPSQVDEAGIPVRNVYTDEGWISEEEYASRDKREAIYDGDKMVYTGPQPAAEDAVEAKSELEKDLEDARTAAPDVGPTEQVEFDRTQEAIDSPGGGPAGRLVVREGEKPLEVVANRNAEQADGSVEPGPQVYASEDPEVLGLVQVEEPSGEEVVEARSEAEEEKMQEIRDKDGSAALDTPEGSMEVREAGAEAVQDEKDSDPDDEQPITDPTIGDGEAPPSDK